MGNCECLRKPIKEDEINIDKKYKSNNSQSEIEKVEKSKKVKYDLKKEPSKMEERLNFEETKVETMKNENKDKRNSTQAFYEATKESIKNIIEIQTYENDEMSKFENNTCNLYNKNRVNLSFDSDLDETIFNSGNYSKSIFQLLNNARSKPISLLNKLNNYDNDKNQHEKKRIFNFINSLPILYKGKTFLWNEKLYSTMRPLYQKIVDGELNGSINQLLEETKYSPVIDSYYETSGNYDVNHMFFTFLYENSHHIKKILYDNIPICSICSVKSRINQNIYTCIILIKKK